MVHPIPGGLTPFQIIFGRPTPHLPIVEELQEMRTLDLCQQIWALHQTLKDLRLTVLQCHPVPIHSHIHSFEPEDRVLVKTCRQEPLQPKWEDHMRKFESCSLLYEFQVVLHGFSTPGPRSGHPNSWQSWHSHLLHQIPSHCSFPRDSSRSSWRPHQCHYSCCYFYPVEPSSKTDLHRAHVPLHTD